MKKILSVVGARPQFIKAAVVSRELRKEYKEVSVHTGQHYSYNMSELFFDELEIPKPDYNLGISGGSHGEMTGRMLIELEKVILKEKPDGMLLYGDTNSTMAAALAGVKQHIPIAHVESGNRFGTLDSPEEVNRIVTDHVSKILMCCTESAREFLVKEGLSDRAYVVGDPMLDAFKFYTYKISDEAPEKLIDLQKKEIKVPENFYYLTCHRQENTETDETLFEILSAMNELDSKCIYPVHPRNQERVKRLKKKNDFSNIIFCEPVGYLMSIYLVNRAKKIVTDSGGLQREAYFAQKQCVTILDFIVWKETMKEGRNRLAKPLKEDILKKLDMKAEFGDCNEFGDGNSAKKIIELLKLL